MYLNLEKIIKDFNLNIRGSIHIGAHKGEEIFSYYRNNIKSDNNIETPKTDFSPQLSNLN